MNNYIPITRVTVCLSKEKNLMNIIDSLYGWVLVKQEFFVTNKMGHVVDRLERFAKYIDYIYRLDSLINGDIIEGQIVTMETLSPLSIIDISTKMDFEAFFYKTVKDKEIYQLNIYDRYLEMNDVFIEHDNQDQLNQIAKELKELSESKKNNQSTLLNKKQGLKKYLFFDAETTGLPKNWNAPVNKLDNWPRLVQLAYLLYDDNNNLISSGAHIIKPEGFVIPNEASSIHGINTENAIKNGESLKDVLAKFFSIIEKADCLVAHNMSYDEKIVGSEFLRIGLENIVHKKKKICTMEASTDFCAIPSSRGYKWPKLSELHYKLFKVNFEEAHNAEFDIKATAKCFWELKRKGIINQ